MRTTLTTWFDSLWTIDGDKMDATNQTSFVTLGRPQFRAHLDAAFSDSAQELSTQCALRLGAPSALHVWGDMVNHLHGLRFAAQVEVISGRRQRTFKIGPISPPKHRDQPLAFVFCDAYEKLYRRYLRLANAERRRHVRTGVINFSHIPRSKFKRTRRRRRH